jgi:FlaA1/EpsC-like NDP-sugar epimerase
MDQNMKRRKFQQRIPPSCQSVRILDLARNLIRLSGRSDQDVEIQFTGLREGEKLDEELFYEHENVAPTVCEKIKRTNRAHRNWQQLCLQLGELRTALTADDAAPIRAKIKQIVPEYSVAGQARSHSNRKTGPEIVFQQAAGDD